MQRNTKYEESELKNCAKDMRDVFSNAGNGSLTAVKRKYSDRKFMYVSRLHLEKVEK